MAYIKLGPIGDQLISRKYNINLPDKKAAAEVPDEILAGPLINFMLTGFIVRITKIEYDNIKIDSRTYQNVPLSNRGVFGENTIEPVITIATQPPLSTPSIGDRYIVFPMGEGPWENFKNQILEYTKDGWVNITPKNKWSVPILAYGISTQYNGTYPSGKWTLEEPKKVEDLDIDLPIMGDPDDPTFEEWATVDYVDQEVNKESKKRSDGDAALQAQITALQTAIQNLPTGGDGGGGPSGPVPASSVSIVDAGDYFVSTNVEGALQELAQQGAGSGGSVKLTIIDIPPMGGAKQTITWDPSLIAKHGSIPVSVTAMIKLPGGSGYRGVSLSQVDYFFNPSGNTLASIQVTFNDLAGKIIIR